MSRDSSTGMISLNSYLLAGLLVCQLRLPQFKAKKVKFWPHAGTCVKEH